MPATQFVRRGLAAFALVATCSLGFSGVAGAQGPGAFIDGDDAIVFNPIPGYAAEIIHTPDGERVAILGVNSGAGLFPVVVRFIDPFDGAAILNTVTADVIAERVADAIDD